MNLTLIDDKKVFKRLLLNSYENIYVDPVNEYIILLHVYVLKFVRTCIYQCVYVYLCADVCI